MVSDEVEVDIEEKDTSWREILKDPAFKTSFEQKYRLNKSGCWVWLLSKDKDGYGQVAVGLGKGRIKRAHRVSYELYTGEAIPEGMDIDHTCHIRRCVNPDHLEVVTHQENMKNLRKTEDWQVSDEEFQRKKTTPELFLSAAVEILEHSKIDFNERLAIGVTDGTPWRDIKLEGGYLPQDKFSRVKLFLDCVRFGVHWEDAAKEVLGVSPWTVHNWAVNKEWHDELTAAKREGRRYRYDTLEDRHLDELERKLDFAEFKDIAVSLKNLREQDEERIAAKKGEQPQSGVNVTIVFGNGNPDKLLRALVETGEIIEGEFEVKNAEDERRKELTA